MTSLVPERKLALIHRVLVQDEDYPKEYAILVSDRRSIFIRQKKTRSGFTLRGEMKYGTALVTDVIRKNLTDYEHTSTDSLSNDNANVTVLHEAVVSLELGKDAQKPGVLDFFVRLTMRMQKEEFQVYNIEMKYLTKPNQTEMIKFYMVPLGEYFKPKRSTQTRETILKEYALENLEIFRKVLPDKIIES